MNRHAATPIPRPDRWAVAVTLAIIALLTLTAPQALLALVIAGLGILAIPAASYLLLAFFAFLLGACVYVNELPIQIGGYRFYGADAMLYLLGAAGLFEAHRLLTNNQNQAASYRGFLYKTELIFVAYGVFALALGLFVHNYGTNNVFGDFRRLFFYSLALLIPLWLPLKRRHLRILPLVFLIGFIGVMMTGAYRLATGQTYREMHFVVMATIPYPRLLSYTEAITFCSALAYFTAVVRLGGSVFVRITAAICATICVGFLVSSGWRLALILAGVIPVATMIFIMWARRESLRGFVVTGVAIGIIAALAAGFMSIVIPEIVDKNVQQFFDRFDRFSLTTDMRYYTWQAAYAEFVKSPIFGAGLGHQLLYPIIGSDGQFYMRESSTHNTLLSILYQAGLIGFGLFATLHAGFIWSVLRVVRRLKFQYLPTLLGLLVLYSSAMAFSVLQPLQVSSIVCIYLAIGFSFAVIRTANEASLEGQ